MSHERPLVAVANDDSIQSPLIHALADGLEQTLDAEVWVVAPERERSAVSHTITLHKPLRVREHAPRRLSVSGTPVDCVYLGMRRLLPRRPALWLSGINNGYNLGTDIFYSGTVGAAVEAGLKGLPAIAVSMDPPAGEEGCARAVSTACRLAKSILTKGDAEGRVFNINVPAGAGSEVRWTRLGSREYSEDVDRRDDPRGKSYWWIGGGIVGVDETPGTDTHAVYCDKVVSVTPLNLDLSARSLLESAKERWPVDG